MESGTMSERDLNVLSQHAADGKIAFLQAIEAK
jgi:hypothetical protein